LELTGRPAEAEGAYRRALQLDPYNHPDYAYDLALLQQQQGRVHEAVQTALAILDQYPEAVIANRSNDDTVRPSLANLWSLVGNIYLQRGDLAQAQAADERALSIDAQNLLARALHVQLGKRQH
jgi:tetratricopeptide (TPR) repeat protein